MNKKRKRSISLLKKHGRHCVKSKVKGQFSINVSLGSGDEGSNRKKKWIDAADKESVPLSRFVKEIVDKKLEEK